MLNVIKYLLKPATLKYMLIILVKIYAVGCILAGIALLFVVYVVSENDHLSWKPCEINVVVEDGLSAEKIKIIYQSEDGRNSVVFENGHMIPFKTEYGKNGFIITYDNKYSLRFGHLIFNNHRYHTYNLKLSRPGNAIWVDADIEGFHAEQFEEPMKEISQVNQP